MFTYTDAYIKNEKANFILKNTAQINLYKVIIEELTKIKSLVTDFDNKVINKRFITEYQKRGYKGYPKIDISYQNVKSLFILFSGREREIYQNDGKFKGYLTDNEVRFNIETTQDKERFNAVETINNIDETIERLNKTISNLQNCIDNYDTFMQQSYEIEKLIEEYKKNVPYNIALRITINRPF